MPKPKISLSFVTLIIIMIAYTSLRVTNPQKNYMCFDNFGYYMYLPSLFINNDLGISDKSYLEKINNQYDNTPTYYQFEPVKGQWIIRFFMGISVMMLPFFFIGHLIALLTAFPADGFSLPYHWSLMMGGLFYTLIGMFFFRKVLLHFFNDRVTSLLMILIYFGSILFFFAVYGNDVPHVYIFTLYSIILWLTIRWHEKQKLKYAVFLGLIIGLTLLVRPSELICVFIPLLWGVKGLPSFIRKLQLFLKYYKHVTIALLMSLLVCGPQFIYWKTYTGDWIYFAYTDPGSGFDFLSPHLERALIGFRKGWLIYSPLMVFSLIGFYNLYKWKKDVFFPIFIYTLLNIYIISSFSSMISYGYRAFVESHAVLALPLGFFITDIMKGRLKILRYLFLFIFILIIAYNQFTSWQIKHGIIHGSRMTPEYYFAVFGKTDITREDQKLLLVNRSINGVEKIKNEENYNKRLLDSVSFETVKRKTSGYYDSTISHSGKYSFRMDSTMIYSPKVQCPFHEITDHYYAWIRSSVYIYPTSEMKSEDLFLVTHFLYNSRPHKYRTSSNRGKKLKVNQWNKMDMDYLTPEMRSRDEICRIYIWYRGKEIIYIDDLKVEIFEPSQNDR